jgi:hypothetical protein
MTDTVRLSQPSTEPLATAKFTQQIVLFSLAFATILASAALVMTGSADGWRVATEMVSRFSVVLFVAATSVEPLARIFPSESMATAGREHNSLMIAFVAAFTASLVCIVAPSAIGSTALSIPAIFYCALNGGVLFILLSSSTARSIAFLSARSLRAMQRIATAYYWLAFTMWDLGRLGSSSGHDGWYAFSLFLLAGVVFVKLADWFVARQRARQVAEKVA